MLLMKQALAHEYETDHGIEATLHIDPADHPVVGKSAQFYFTFQDDKKTFDIHRCNCVITLFKDDHQIDQQSISLRDSVFSSLKSQSLYSKTFADPGTYVLELSGSPNNGATFPEFVLHYDVAVVDSGVTEEGHHHSLTSEHLGHIIIFGVGFLITIGMLVNNYYQSRWSQAKAITSQTNIDK